MKTAIRIILEALLYFVLVVAIQAFLAYLTNVTVAHAKEHNTALFYIYSYGGGVLLWLVIHNIIDFWRLK